MTALICTAIFSGCSKEQDTPQGENNKVTEFIAYNEGSLSRTVLRENQVKWLGGEEISIFNGDNNYKFTNATEGESATAVFHGELTATANEFYALYPYNENAAISTEGSVIITTNLPANQTAVAGTFANNLNINVCKANDDKTLKFKNACGIIKFIMDKSIVDKISITSTENIAGTYNITLGETITGAINNSEDEQKTITLKPEEGSYLQKETPYYMIVPAGMDLNNVTLTVGEKTGIDITNESKTIAAGTVCTINIEGESASVIQHEELTVNSIEEIAPAEGKDRIKLNTNNANLSINNAEAAKSLFGITVTNTNGISVADEYTVEKVELEENTKNIILTLNKPVYTDDKISVTYNADGSSDAIKAGEKWVKITTAGNAEFTGFKNIVYNLKFTTNSAGDYFTGILANAATAPKYEISTEDNSITITMDEKAKSELCTSKTTFKRLNDAKYSFISTVSKSANNTYNNNLIYRLCYGSSDIFRAETHFNEITTTPTEITKDIILLNNQYYNQANLSQVGTGNGDFGAFRIHLNGPNTTDTGATFTIKDVKIIEEALRPGRSYSAGNTHGGFSVNNGITGSINSNEEEN